MTDPTGALPVLTDTGDAPHGPVRATAEGAAPFDFRRPSLISREDVRGLEVAHELFTRRLATGWGAALRAIVSLEPIAVDQVPFDDYIRSMPYPTALGAVSLPPLPNAALIEVNSQLALLMVDRLLGGQGALANARADLQRRPTELEGVLVRDLLETATGALAGALDEVTDGAELLSVDYNPQHVQVAAPSDMVLVLSYRVQISQGLETEGLLSLCYPALTLKPILEELSQQLVSGPIATDADPTASRRALLDRLDDVDVDVRVRLSDSQVPAADIERLAVGDVLRLEHRVGQPARGQVGDADVVEGHIGRRGRRLAFQVTRWLPSQAGLDAAGLDAAGLDIGGREAGGFDAGTQAEMGQLPAGADAGAPGTRPGGDVDPRAAVGDPRAAASLREGAASGGGSRPDPGAPEGEDASARDRAAERAARRRARREQRASGDSGTPDPSSPSPGVSDE